MMADGSQGRVFPFRCHESEEEGDEIRDRVPRTLNGEERGPSLGVSCQKGIQ